MCSLHLGCRDVILFISRGRGRQHFDRLRRGAKYEKKQILLADLQGKNKFVSIFQTEDFLWQSKSTGCAACILDAGTSFCLFLGGRGNILTVFVGGAKYEKNKILCAKTQQITIFQNPPLPPPMTSLS